MQEHTRQILNDYTIALESVTAYDDTPAYADTYRQRRTRPETPCSKARTQANLLRQLAKHIERAAKLETAQIRAQRHADRLAQQLQGKRDVCERLAQYLQNAEQGW